MEKVKRKRISRKIKKELRKIVSVNFTQPGMRITNFKSPLEISDIANTVSSCDLLYKKEPVSLIPNCKRNKWTNILIRNIIRDHYKMLRIMARIAFSDMNNTVENFLDLSNCNKEN